jgi:hypothetical protein
MEDIRRAVERAKAGTGRAGARSATGQNWPQTPPRLNGTHVEPAVPGNTELQLNDAHLRPNRIISHDKADPRARSYDMLRTQVLQSMDLKGSQLLAVTSPTVGCGKTLTAINLALSIARQHERSVLLVDMDFRKPQVASCLGLGCNEGLLGVIEGRTALSNAILQVQVDDHRFKVLPTEASTLGSAELMASSAMITTLQEIKRENQSRIVIVDLPPILCSDDVITILPQVDCVLLVAAVGTTTVAEIEECSRHLQSSDVVRLVLNKAAEPGTKDYYY